MLFAYCITHPHSTIGVTPVELLSDPVRLEVDHEVTTGSGLSKFGRTS